MIIGFDYYQCISHFPKEFQVFEEALYSENELHVISAVGQRSKGTVKDNVLAVLPEFWEDNIHEVVFNHPRESPQLKLEKCKELGIQIFVDDRSDVCELLNANGIMALQVHRRKKGSDIGSEQK